MFAGSQVAEGCSGAAIKSAVEALKGGSGGRLHAFVSSLPRKGVLALRPRDLGRPPTDRCRSSSGRCGVGVVSAWVEWWVGWMG